MEASVDLLNEPERGDNSLAAASVGKLAQPFADIMGAVGMFSLGGPVAAAIKLASVAVRLFGVIGATQHINDLAGTLEKRHEGTEGRRAVNGMNSFAEAGGVVASELDAG